MVETNELSILPVPVPEAHEVNNPQHQRNDPPQGEGSNSAVVHVKNNWNWNPFGSSWGGESEGGGDNHSDDNDSGYQQSLDDDLRRRIEEAKRDRHILFQDYAPSSAKLGIFSTSCLLINRMIGTGIFETPKSVWLGTGSVSASLFMWCVGGLLAFGGLLVYLELGLTIPRYLVRGEWRSVPRSGGEKNYLEFMYKTPKFFTTSVYAVVVILLGNTAGNGIVFGTKVLQIIKYPDVVDINDNRTGWMIKGLGIFVVTIACLLHGAWRAGGIWLQNAVGVVKVAILWFFILVGLAAYSGKMPSVPNPGQELTPSSSFERSDAFTVYYGAHGWITTLLDVTFSFSGFEAAHYVLGEVEHPESKLKWSTLGSLSLVTISYVFTNISFFTVVTAEQLMSKKNSSLSTLFIMNVFSGSDKAKRSLPALVAISAFGNILVTTFMAAKVKQEIAKEGVLPFSSFLRSEYRSPLRKLLGTSSSAKFADSDVATPVVVPYEKTPMPALLLHWITSLILILSPPAGDTYTLFTRLRSYLLHAWFGVFLGGGLLYYGYYRQYRSDKEGRKYRWKDIAGFRPWLGPIFPAIYFFGNSAIVIGDWIPPTNGKETTASSIAWFVTPTVGMSLFAVGVLYWLVLTHLLPLWNHKTLRVRRTPFLDADENFRYEEVITKWIAGPEDEPETGDPALQYH